MNEHGRERRVSVNRQFLPYSKFVSECIVNLSRRGAFIATTGKLPKAGSTVRLRHTIVSDRIETIVGQGRVVRVSETPHGVGVVFEDLTQASEDAIDGLLDPRTMRPVGGSTIDMGHLKNAGFVR